MAPGRPLVADPALDGGAGAEMREDPWDAEDDEEVGERTGAGPGDDDDASDEDESVRHREEAGPGIGKVAEPLGHAAAKAAGAPVSTAASAGRKVAAQRCARRDAGVILVCGICASTSKTETWFEYGYVRGRRVPQGGLCSCCGTVCEAFPLLTTSQCLANYQEDEDFRVKFDLARQVLNKERNADWRQSQVCEARRMGMRIEHAFAFVQESIFERFFNKSLKDLNIPSVVVPDITGKDIHGMLLRAESIPPDSGLHFQRVTMYYDIGTTWHEIFVGEGESLRELQAKDTFDFLNKMSLEDRSPSLSQGKLPEVLTFAAIEARKKSNDEEIKRNEEIARNLADAGSDGDEGNTSGAVRTETCSRLRRRVSDADRLALRPARGKCKAKANSSGGGGGGGTLKRKQADSGHGAALAMDGDGRVRASAAVALPGGSVVSVGQGSNGSGRSDICPVEKVLCGYSPGRELKGIKNHMAETTSWTKKEELAAQLEALEAAKIWQVRSMSVATTADLIKAHTVLTVDSTVTIPDINLLSYTRKVVNELFVARKYDKWAEQVFLHLVKEVFDATRPAYCAFVIPEVPAVIDDRDDAPPPEPRSAGKKRKLQGGEDYPPGGDDDGEDFTVQPLTFRNFRMQWISGVLPDGFVGLLSGANLSTDAGREAAEHLTTVLSEFLSLAKLDEEIDDADLYGDDKKTPRVVLLQPVCKVFHGLIALLDPEPFFLGSSVSDVDFIVPDYKGRQRTPSMLTDTIIGRGVAKILHRVLNKSAFWMERVSEYVKHAGAEAVHHSAFLAVQKCFADMSGKTPSDHVDYTARLDAYNTLEREYAAMHAALRPGALDRLEEMATNIMARDVEDWERTTPEGDGVQLMLLYDQVLARLLASSPGKTSIQQVKHDLQDMVMHARGKEALAKLHAACAAPFSDMTHATTLLDAVRKCQAERKDMNLRNKIIDACDLVVNLVSTNAVGAIDAAAGDPPTSIDVPPLLDLLQRGMALVEFVCQENVAKAEFQDDYRKSTMSFCDLVRSSMSIIEAKQQLSDRLQTDACGGGELALLEKRCHAHTQKVRGLEGLRDSGPAGKAGAEVCRAMEPVVQGCRSVLAQACSAKADHLLQRLQQATSSLHAVAGGGGVGTNGEPRSWVEGLAPGSCVLKHFAETLNKQDHGFVEKALCAAVQARKDYTAAASAYEEYGFDKNPDELGRNLDTVKAAMTTKMECLLARTFGKSQSGWQKDRIKKTLLRHTMEFVNSCRRDLNVAADPRECMCPALRALYDPATS